MHSEAVKKLGQAPSRLLIFQGFHRFRSEPALFFHSLSGCTAARSPADRLRLTDFDPLGLHRFALGQMHGQHAVL
jgi:hypothetical protein